MTRINDSYIFSSERVGMRLWRDDDVAEFAAMCADADVMEFFPKTLTYEESAAQVETKKAHHAEHGFGLWVAEEIATGEFIGMIGFAIPTFKEWFTPCVEIGWRFNKKFWNQGLATEAARACIDFGFTSLGFDEIYSFTSFLNIPSERVMQKIGMERVGEFDHPKLEVGHRLRQHVLYKIEVGE